MPVCTYYDNDGTRNADGSRYTQSAPFVASRIYPLGTRLRLVNPATGRALVVTVRDRTAPGRTNLDLPRRCFGFLARGGYRLGVLRLRVRVLSRPHKARHGRHQ